MDTIVIVAIISSGAGIVGAVGSQIVNAIASNRREKRALAERVFNQLFPERIKAHEDIIRGVHEIGIPKLLIRNTVPDNYGELLTDMADALGRLWVRYQVTASTKILEPLLDLGVALREGNVIIASKAADEAFNAFNKTARRCHNLYFMLLEGARAESGAKMTDEARAFVLDEVEKQCKGVVKKNNDERK